MRSDAWKFDNKKEILVEKLNRYQIRTNLNVLSSVSHFISELWLNTVLGIVNVFLQELNRKSFLVRLASSLLLPMKHSVILNKHFTFTIFLSRVRQAPIWPCFTYGSLKSQICFKTWVVRCLVHQRSIICSLPLSFL